MADAPKFEVAYDKQSRVLRTTMRGFWSLADVAAFRASLRRAVEPLGAPPQKYDNLCDSRDFPVQSGEVSDALGEGARVAPQMQEGRIAVVVGSMMGKIQARRALAHGEVQVFLSMEDAKAWLEEAQGTQ